MAISLAQIKQYEEPNYDLSNVGQSECGRMPIFLIKVQVKWKTKQSQRDFDLAVKMEMIYKGPGQPQSKSNRWLDKFKANFFKSYLPRGKDASDAQLKTFTIVSFQPIVFLGYKNTPGLE